MRSKHTMELTYTFRGVDDAEFQTRIAEILPMLQAMMETCEDRHAAWQAEREAAKATRLVPQQASMPADLQQLVKQAAQPAAASCGGHRNSGSEPQRVPPRCCQRCAYSC